MFLIIGYVVILAASLGTYAIHGSLAALWVPTEYVAIIGLTIGGFVAGNGINGVALRNGSTNNGWANLIQRNQIYANGVTTPGVGIGIDLEHDIDVADVQPDPAGDDPNTNYANYGQNQPTVCTGAGVPLPACVAPGFNSGSGATTTAWSIATRPNTSLRIEYFALRPDGMTFLFDELVTTDAAGLPVRFIQVSNRFPFTGQIIEVNIFWLKSASPGQLLLKHQVSPVRPQPIITLGQCAHHLL